METILIRALQLVLSLSILVIVHEFGHFIFARIFGVRVEKFYLFFNPWYTPLKFKPKNSETEYGVGWLPLGGYVKLSGMMDESMDKDQMSQPEQPWEFRAKPAWKRLLIMIGGVLMNFLLAFFIYSMVMFCWGEEYFPVKSIKMGLSYNEMTQKAGLQNGDLPLTADGVDMSDLDILDSKTRMMIAEAKELTVLRNGQVVKIALPADFHKIIFEKEENLIPRFPFIVQSVNNSTPAKKAGLESGDSIVGVNGDTKMSITELTQAFTDNINKPITLNVYRNNELKELSITPDENGKIGVAKKSPYKIYQTVKREYGFFASIPAGVKLGIETIQNYVGQFKYMFTKQGAESLGGFGTIASIFPPVWDWEAFWSMTAFLSIILGVMNLLPIPALDGGHVMFLLYEVITGRKPNEKFMEYAQMAGMIFLLALLIFANGNDIFRLFNK